MEFYNSYGTVSRAWATVPELRSNLERSVTYEKISFTAFTDEVAADLEKLGRKKVIVEKRPILYA